MVSYQEFISKLNDKTREFVIEFLTNLESYVGQNREKLKVEGRGDLIRNKYDKAMLISLYTITNDLNINEFFRGQGFNRNKIKIVPSTSEPNLEKTYNAIANCFSFDVYEYSEITPLEIIKGIYDKYYDEGNKSVLDDLIDIYLESFQSKLEDKIEEVSNERAIQIEKEIYKDVPIEVVSYLDCASRIFECLNESNLNEDFIKDAEDLTQISLLLAVYYYDEYKKDDEKSEKEWIIDFLDSHGIVDYNIETKLDIYSLGEKSKGKENIYVVKAYLMKYLEGMDAKTATVADVLGNVIKKGKTKSRLLEKLLTVDMDSTLDLNEDFVQALNTYKNSNINNDIKDRLNEIYGFVTNDAKERMEIASKVYSLILKKTNNNSNSLLQNSDIGALSVFLSYYYSNPNFREFLHSKGISSEKIFNQYGMNMEITAEEVEHESINYKLFVNIYDIFLKSTNRKDKTLAILNEKLENNTFIINLFKNMAGILDARLWSEYNKYSSNKVNEENKKLKNYFCSDLDPDTIIFIERVSTTYANLLDVASFKENLTPEDMKFVTIILTCLRDEKDIICKMLVNNGFSFNAVQNFFKIGRNYGANRDVDYKFIIDEFSYIFKDGVSRKEINENKIVKDAFKFDLSPQVAKFFNEYGIKVDYDNFDTKMAETIEDIKIEKVKIDITSKLINYNYDTKREIIMVLKTYDYILMKISAGEMNTDLIKDKDDIKELALLIGILTGENNYKKFFEKRNITLENVLKLSGLTEKDLKTIKANPDVILPFLEFEKYFEDRKDPSHAIFMSDVNKSQVLETITAKADNNYEHLETEVTYGKDYEMTLSVDDRIELLKKQEVDTIDYEDIVSILHFGDSLKIHSNYINDEFPKVASSEIHDKSISDLNQLISSVCKDKEQERKKGLLALFGKKEEKVKMVDKTSLKALKESIDDNISLLSQEIVGYDTIRKYLEAYYAKNIEYMKKANEVVEAVSAEVTKLDSKNPYEYAKFVQLTSLLQVVKDKANRFSTTCRLIEQQLLRINQSTASHFITINALETAKNDLFPLVGTEIAIARGIESEKESIEATENVMNLFKSLLARNIDEAKDTLDKLRGLDLPEGYVVALESDLKQYSEQVESAKMPSLPGLNLETSYTPTLELEDENTNGPKKKLK